MNRKLKKKKMGLSEEAIKITIKLEKQKSRRLLKLVELLGKPKE